MFLNLIYFYFDSIEWIMGHVAAPLNSICSSLFCCLACLKLIVQIKQFVKLSTGKNPLFYRWLSALLLLPVSDDDSAVKYVNSYNSGPRCVCWHTKTLVCRLKDAHCLILHRQSIFKPWWKVGRGGSEMNSNGKNNLNHLKVDKKKKKVTLCTDPDRSVSKSAVKLMFLYSRQNPFEVDIVPHTYLLVCIIIWPKTLSPVKIQIKTHSSMLN